MEHVGEGGAQGMVLRTGDRLGRYEILGPLGAGGMGEVYRARDRSLARDVAVKVLPHTLVDSPDRMVRFEREAQAVARLSHPAILDIHDFGRHGDVVFAVTELLEGQTLRERLDHGRMGWREVAAVGADIADGLAAAHRAGIIHRDVKPSNLFLTDDGRVKILDFGLAKQVESGERATELSGLPTQQDITEVGTVVGTEGYMSPEQLRGLEADERSDIFSLGCVLYELVAGRRAFRGDSAVNTIAAILTAEPPSFSDTGADAPSAFEEVVRRCLEKRPEQRFQSATDLAFDLRSLISDPVPRSRTAVRRRKGALWSWPRVVASTVVLSALVGVGMWLSRRPALAFQHRDHVLVADVDNQTGEPVFDVALRTAIEADLAQSSYAIVYDRAQVAETLRLMRRDPTTRVDEELGCDICRFAGVRALVVPRIGAAGDAYELQAILVDPVERRHVDRIRVAALGREDVLLDAVDDLAREVREHLGESIDSIEESDVPAVQLTTSSWEALRHYSAARSAWWRADFREAAALFELALEEDPEFAMARRSLGLALIQFLDEPERGKKELERALADSEYLPRRERLLIRASNLEFVDGDLEGALETYRMLQQLYPDSATPFNNAGMILRRLGRYDEAITMYQHALEVEPFLTPPLYNLYYTNMFERFDPVAAEAAARRLVEASPDLDHPHHALAWSLIAQGRLEEALQPLRRTLEISPHHRYALPNLAHVLLALGRPDEAVPVYREVKDLVESGAVPGSLVKSTFDLAYATRAAGDPGRAAEIAKQGRRVVETTLGGGPAGARELLLLGQFDVLADDRQAAASRLRRAIDAGVDDPEEMTFLAELYALLDDRDRAIETLAKALDAGYQDRFFPRVMPAFTSIRDDPRFDALMAPPSHVGS